MNSNFPIVRTTIPRRKIAVIFGQNPMSHASGAARLCRSITEYFARRGLDVHTLYLDGVTSTPTSGNNYPFKSHVLRSLSPGLFKHILSSNYHAYVMVGMDRLSIGLLVMWLRFRSKAVLLLPVWHHDFVFHTSLAKYLFHLKRLMVDFPILRLFAGPVVCQSDYERRSLLHFSKELTLVHYGINTHDSIWSLCWRIRRLKRKSRQELNIVASGRLMPSKIPLYFLQVVSKLLEKRGVRFQIFVARADYGYFKRFVSEIRRLRLEHVVDIVDVSGLSKERVFARLARGDVAVCPYFSEAFGLSVVEYAYSGIPVVATRTGVVEYLERKNCLVAVNWGDTNGLVDAILRIDRMSHRERENLSKTAKRVIEMDFTVDRFLGSLWNILDHQLGSGAK
jgi:glycosyltransferase involved in cell wall biosynthesis